MKCECPLLLSICVLVLGLQLNIIEIRAGPISNYGGYRADLYYIQVSPRTLYEEPVSESDIVVPQSRQNFNRQPGRPQVHPTSYNNRHRITYEDDNDFGPFAFPSSAQRTQTYNRRPVLSRQVTPDIPQSPTNLWNKFDKSAEDGKEKQPVNNESLSKTEVHEFESLPTAEALIRGPGNNKNRDDDDEELLLGDFYKWMGQESKFIPEKNRPVQPNPSKYGQLGSLKPKKIENIDYENFATKTNTISAEKDKDEDKDEDDKDSISEHSLLSALNDRKCKPDQKKVEGGGCKPIIRV